MERKRYAVVGTGSRSWMYTKAIVADFADVAELVAFCDANQSRMDFYNRQIADTASHPPVPTYPAHEFDRMVAEQAPDAVVVTSIDRTHHRYICRAMELGCDAVTEKPMTVDEEKCQRILDTVEATGRSLTVTFNYRYAPRNTKVKEVLAEGIAGDILSVHFEWLLDTSHGADYFRRWHRDKRNSGGLLVHKATHHFDLINWWLDSRPATVYAKGDLRFYGRENAEERGVTQFYQRARGNETAEGDPFALSVTEKDTFLKGLYYEAEHEDGYHRDQSVFGDGISIEDTMALLVQYANKTVMTYSLNAYCPWEGYRVMFNGTKGRLEFSVVERSYVSGGKEDFNMPGMRELADDETARGTRILFQPQWGKTQAIEFEQGNVGGHGGGDVRLLNHVFRGVDDDPLGHAADHRSGAMSILTGIAANHSLRTGQPVTVDSLLRSKL
mgnify:CR=1 FL=1